MEARELTKLTPKKRVGKSRSKKKQDDCENAIGLLKQKAPKPAQGCAAPFRPVPPQLHHVQPIAPHTLDGPPPLLVKDVASIPPGEESRITSPVVI